jgi:hypothetical protein
LVEKRLRLWENIKELKKDKYFSKYIIFDVWFYYNYLKYPLNK